ncbi:MAG: phosphoglycerate kinase [Parcubacteria group bacterium GW2011_GWA2_38_13b]|nr:MAG: phosphoglycerate kinase [Parcubacteria group bacterium GW2011_GWA2_38_13b]
MKLLKNSKIKNKIVLLRVDFNLPMENGRVLSDEDYRVKAALPTIKFLLKNGNKIILISHLGRPNGRWDENYSLKPLVSHLEDIIGEKINFIEDDIRGLEKINCDKICLLENIRFYAEEEENNEKFAKKLASFADIFVNDAFSVCHRAHASVEAVTEFLPCFIGLSLAREIDILDKAIKNPAHPVAVIVGGLKAETKVKVIGNFLPKADFIMLGGVVANTILSVRGEEVGRSIISPEVIPAIKKMKVADIKLTVPVDVVVSKDLDGVGGTTTIQISGVVKDDIILDIGGKSADLFCSLIKKSKTIIWNGPMGRADMEIFSNGTKAIAKAIGRSGAYSIIGGGDTIAVINKMGIMDKFSYISTGGGAMLEYLAGNKLPGIEALK